MDKGIFILLAPLVQVAWGEGAVTLRCDACGLDRLLPFSCKRRGFCPSCGGRRMTERAAHAVDAVLPPVPVRQWVGLVFTGWNEAGRRRPPRGSLLYLGVDAVATPLKRVDCCPASWSSGDGDDEIDVARESRNGPSRDREPSDPLLTGAEGQPGPARPRWSIASRRRPGASRRGRRPAYGIAELCAGPLSQPRSQPRLDLVVGEARMVAAELLRQHLHPDLDETQGCAYGSSVR